VEAGAVAFLHKATAFDVLLSTIERVAAGDELISSGQRQELLGALGTSRAANDQRLARLATLTLREQHVLGALVTGQTAAEIAETSYVSVKTVRTQIESVRRKLGVRSQLAAVAFARELGWRPGNKGLVGGL
jgi:DNA-binding NarL/FixJ family response regulator